MKRINQLPGWILLACTMLGTACSFASDRPVPPHREQLLSDWHQLPEPPVTPYHGPFGDESRAFVGKKNQKGADAQARANWKAKYDFKHTAANGVYDPARDPRPINEAFEAAMLEDWRRMGYNCAYKGNYFTFMVGSWLKQQGMLGAIDQTLFGQNGPPPVGFDGNVGRKQREACGSFFHPDNFQSGVDAITGMGHHYGKHLFTVGDHKLTCSWDEVGMRTRAQLDYHPQALVEFRMFLEQVWFQDTAPGQDSNRDGRTYNSFTGERLKTWDDVQPIPLSLNWAMPARRSDGSWSFSARPEVDQALFQQPARYKLWIDFHRYFTFEFFRRINEQATANMNQLGTPGRISCYPFAQHFIIWPGINQRHGNSYYWYHRLSPVVNVEHCWPDMPAMPLNYAITDHMAKKWKNPVMGWAWFYFGAEGADMYNGPHDIDRAMARMMGHRVDGIHHWMYSPIYRGRDRTQRRQIAYWLNFLGHHYRGYLSRSEPLPAEVAVLMPDWTGYFYRVFQYPKQDWAYTTEALQRLQYAYEVVLEEELELHEDALAPYKVLYVIGSEWSTPAIRKRITQFIAGGGVVYANVDSLSLDIATGERVDFLEKHFGVSIREKHKNAFYPSTQSVEEAEWAMRLSPYTKLQGHHVHLPDDPRAWSLLYKRTPEHYVRDEAGNPQRDAARRIVRHPDWKMIRDGRGKLVRDEVIWAHLDRLMESMPRQVRGLSQRPLDMREPPRIRYAAKVVPQNKKLRAADYPTWGEINTAKVKRGTSIAWWGNRVCGVETDRTVWMGTREGMSLHALAPRMSMHRTTEPCNPFPSEVPDRYEAGRPYVEALGYGARKAGVARPVSLTRNGVVPMNLEVLPRMDPQGTLMVVVINHDATRATYQAVLGPGLMKKLAGAQAWNMLTEKIIETETDGKFDVPVPAWGVTVFMVGRKDRLAPIKEAQSILNRKDLSVPKYFQDRPALNEPEYNTPIPPLNS